MNNTHKIEKFLQKELASGLNDICIIDYGNGTFELFNQYTVKKDALGLYTVNHILIFVEQKFSSLKNAFTWCIFHKNKRFTDSKRIEELDMQLNSIAVRMFQQKKLLGKSKDLEHKLIYTAKLHEEKIKKNRMLKELSQYINISKQWQTKKFLDKMPK